MTTKNTPYDFFKGFTASSQWALVDEDKLSKLNENISSNSFDNAHEVFKDFSAGAKKELVAFFNTIKQDVNTTSQTEGIDANDKNNLNDFLNFLTTITDTAANELRAQQEKEAKETKELEAQRKKEEDKKAEELRAQNAAEKVSSQQATPFKYAQRNKAKM